MVLSCVIDGLFGVRGHRDGLLVNPQLPSAWQQASVVRRFRGAEYVIRMQRVADVKQTEVYVDGQLVPQGLIRDVQAGKTYQVEVRLPLEG